MTFEEWMGGKQRYDFEKMYDDYLRDLESQDQENKYPRDEAADGGRIGFADGGSGESSGIYGLLKQGIKNIEKGGLDSLFGERDNLSDKEFKDGGRIGYAAGGTSFAQQSNAENIKERSDQMEQIKRDMEDRIKSGSRTQGLEIGQLTEDMYGRPKTEYNIYNPSPEAQNYAAALNQGLRPEQIKAVSYYNTLRNNFGDEGMMLPEAMGGSGLMGGSEPISPNNSLSNPLSVQNFFQTPKEMFALYQEGLRRSMMQGDSEVYFDPDKTYDAGDYVSPKGIYTFRDIDPNVVNRGMMVDGKEYSSEQDAIDAMGVERYNKFMATGGRVSLKNGGLATMFRLK